MTKKIQLGKLKSWASKHLREPLRGVILAAPAEIDFREYVGVVGILLKLAELDERGQGRTQRTQVGKLLVRKQLARKSHAQNLNGGERMSDIPLGLSRGKDMKLELQAPFLNNFCKSQRPTTTNCALKGFPKPNECGLMRSTLAHHQKFGAGGLG